MSQPGQGPAQPTGHSPSQRFRNAVQRSIVRDRIDRTRTRTNSDATSTLITSPSSIREHVARRRGCGGLIDRAIVPNEDVRDTIYQHAVNCLETTGQRAIFFNHVKLFPDGGLHKPSNGDLLYDRWRALHVGLTLGLVAFNMKTIFGNGISVLTHKTTGEEHQVVIGNFIIFMDPNTHMGHYYVWITACIVASMEMVVMLSKFGYAIYVVCRYSYWATAEELQHYRIYHQLYDVCCRVVPSLTNFSALKILSFVQPQALAHSLHQEMANAKKEDKLCCIVVGFIIRRSFLGVIGFVAFCLKLLNLIALLAVQMDPKVYNHWAVLTQFWLIFGFVNQMLGITQISQVERDRLFLFIFGGADATMQDEEIDRQEAFLACVAHSILSEFFVGEELSENRRRFRRTVALLSFTHRDIQRMALDENRSAIDSDHVARLAQVFNERASVANIVTEFATSPTRRASLTARGQGVDFATQLVAGTTNNSLQDGATADNMEAGEAGYESANSAQDSDDEAREAHARSAGSSR